MSNSPAGTRANFIPTELLMTSVPDPTTLTERLPLGQTQGFSVSAFSEGLACALIDAPSARMAIRITTSGNPECRRM
jgi:hypothetical protein